MSDQPVLPGVFPGVIEIARAQFDGETFEPALDSARLTGQLKRVYRLMKDGRWRTLQEIGFLTQDSDASVSARLRDLRKDRFGAYRIDRRRRGDGKRGLFEYRLVV